MAIALLDHLTNGRDRVKKALAVLALTAGLATVGVGSAAAGIFTHSTTGGRINGSYTFLPKGNNHGGFQWSGVLDDTSNDGNAMKVQVKVHGCGYKTYYNNVDTDKYWYDVRCDGAMTQANYAQAKICRDRGSFVPDNCSPEYRYNR